ncbi:MAG: hypothetical protein AAGH57_00925 [Pseudomonadota bacterium]
MDHDTQSAIRSGIVNRARYANDPAYRHAVDIHNPMAAPTRLKQFPEEYYARNRAAAAQGLWETLKWTLRTLIPSVFALLTLVFFALALPMVTEGSGEVVGFQPLSFVGLGAAFLVGITYALMARAKRIERNWLRFIAQMFQGATLAACIVMVPLFLFLGHQDAIAGRGDGFAGVAILMPILVAGLAAILSYRRWMLTGFFAAYAGALTGIALLIA